VSRVDFLSTVDVLGTIDVRAAAPDRENDRGPLSNLPPPPPPPPAPSHPHPSYLPPPPTPGSTNPPPPPFPRPPHLQHQTHHLGVLSRCMPVSLRPIFRTGWQGCGRSRDLEIVADGGCCVVDFVSRDPVDLIGGSRSCG